MKKVMLCLLLVALLLSLCACGGNPYPQYEHINQMLDAGNYEGAIRAIYLLAAGQNTNNAPDDTQTTQPTDEEKRQLEIYCAVYRYLTEGHMYYGDSGLFYDFQTGFFYTRERTLKNCYEALQNLDAVEKWADSEYVRNDVNFKDVPVWDCQALLADFTVIRDVVLEMKRTREDHLGNINTNTMTIWRYDTDGRLAELEGGSYANIVGFNTGSDTAWYEYDDQGRLVSQKHGYGANTITAICTYTYDEAGQTVTELKKTNDGEQVFTYSYKDGRLESVSWETDWPARYISEYIYDDAGNLIREETISYIQDYHYYYDVIVWAKAGAEIMEYVYVDGLLTSGTLTTRTYVIGWEGMQKEPPVETECIDRYTYTCDSQGRVLTETIIPGNTVDCYMENNGNTISTPDYVSIVYRYTYGDYFIYPPVK